MTEELDMLADQSRRFFETECQPNYERWEKEGQIDRAVWLKAGALGLLGAVGAGSLWRPRRQLRP